MISDSRERGTASRKSADHRRNTHLPVTRLIKRGSLELGSSLATVELYVSRHRNDPSIHSNLISVAPPTGLVRVGGRSP